MEYARIRSYQLLSLKKDEEHMQPMRWGVPGAATIGLKRAIPAILSSLNELLLAITRTISLPKSGSVC
jgi:hypothetical protein